MVVSMRICKIEGCNNTTRTRGFCKKHYLRVLRHGNPFHVEREMHGMRDTSEYTTWHDMIQRCCNRNNTRYKNYGRRGIVVCDSWLHSFKTFYEDMGSRPFPKAQIDRIDNDSGYYPGNCQWTTAAQNSRNKANNKLTMEKARAIRRKYKLENISQPKLALIYGVYLSSISAIITKKTWKEAI